MWSITNIYTLWLIRVSTQSRRTPINRRVPCRENIARSTDKTNARLYLNSRHLPLNISRCDTATCFIGMAWKCPTIALFALNVRYVENGSMQSDAPWLHGWVFMVSKSLDSAFRLQYRHIYVKLSLGMQCFVFTAISVCEKMWCV